MEEIQVGEYVRLARNQGINRVEDIEDDYYVLEDYFGDDYGEATCCLYKYKVNKDVLNHSPNIIDIIEVGDYVNGAYVRATYLDGETHYIKLNYSDTRVYDYMIESIVTKEQFSYMEYRLGGKEE